MTRAREFKVGELYFVVTYDEPGLYRPIVLSYEYLGRDIHGPPDEPSEPRFYFKYLPGVWAPSDDETEEDFWKVPHSFTEQELETMQDIDGLIAALGEVRDRLGRR